VPSSCVFMVVAGGPDPASLWVDLGLHWLDPVPGGVEVLRARLGLAPRVPAYGNLGAGLGGGSPVCGWCRRRRTAVGGGRHPHRGGSPGWSATGSLGPVAGAPSSADGDSWGVVGCGQVVGVGGLGGWGFYLHFPGPFSPRHLPSPLPQPRSCCSGGGLPLRRALSSFSLGWLVVAAPLGSSHRCRGLCHAVALAARTLVVRVVASGVGGDARVRH
jgi:hypothetical protein